MRIKFLGTSAAEGVPAPFCQCQNCEMSRSIGKKNFRKRSSVLFDDELLVDCGPDFSLACKEHNIDSSKINSVLITHSHFDHFYAENFEIRSERYLAEVPTKIDCYGNPIILYKLNQLGYSMDEMHLRTHSVIPNQWENIKKYKVLPFLANHAHEFGMAYNYIIEGANKKKILYGNDTGIYSKEALVAIKDMEVDLFITDLTNYRNKSTSLNHLNMESFSVQKEKLYEYKVINQETKIIATHFSHNAVEMQDDMEKYLEDKNMYPAYDGYEVEI